MPGAHLFEAVAFAMLVYAGLVEGGCRGVLSLIGPPDPSAVSKRDRDDQVAVDRWDEAVRDWRQQTSGLGL